jgi:hypothetical protein
MARRLELIHAARRRVVRKVLPAGVVLFAIAAAPASLATAAAASASAANTALLDGESVTTLDGIEKEGTPISLEQYAAERAGFTVTVRSGAEWEAMTAEEFSHYQLLVVGDPKCSFTAESAVNSAKTWTPVVMGSLAGVAGNRVVVGTDPEFHYAVGGGGAQPKEPGNPSSAGAEHLVQDGITFAGGVSGATGVYFDTSCADIPEPGEEEAAAKRIAHRHGSGQEVEGPDGRDKTEILDHLTETKETWTEDATPPCGGSVQQIAANPVFDTGETKLLDSDIQGWECSDHVTFPSFPADWFALAVATDTASHPTCGTDPETKEEVCGEAYVLLAGKGIVAEAPNLSLAPKSHSDPAGGMHTVTATVSKGAKLLAGVVVTFVVTGQNAGAAGTCKTGKGAADPTCETDAAGEVQFTYSDGNGPGSDTIGASVTVGESTEHATASEEWVGEEAQPTSLKTMLGGEGKEGATISVSEGAAVDDSVQLEGTNAAKATGTVTYSVYADPECTKFVASAGTVPVSGGVAPVSAGESLAAGTYYWQASYSGDAANLPSKSTCGSEVLTVTPKSACTTVEGETKATIDKERQRAVDRLSTDLARRRQKFVFSWSNGEERVRLTKLTAATCTVSSHGRMKFKGRGAALLNGVPGYTVKFAIAISTQGANEVVMRLYQGSKKVASFVLDAKTTQKIS